METKTYEVTMDLVTARYDLVGAHLSDGAGLRPAIQVVQGPAHPDTHNHVEVHPARGIGQFAPGTELVYEVWGAGPDRTLPYRTRLRVQVDPTVAVQTVPVVVSGLRCAICGPVRVLATESTPVYAPVAA